MVNASQFDIRRVIKMLEAGLSMHDVAKRQNHDRWWRKFQQEGSVVGDQERAMPEMIDDLSGVLSRTGFLLFHACFTLFKHLNTEPMFVAENLSWFSS